MSHSEIGYYLLIEKTVGNCNHSRIYFKLYPEAKIKCQESKQQLLDIYSKELSLSNFLKNSGKKWLFGPEI